MRSFQLLHSSRANPSHRSPFFFSTRSQQASDVLCGSCMRERRAGESSQGTTATVQSCTGRYVSAVSFLENGTTRGVLNKTNDTFNGMCILVPKKPSYHSDHSKAGPSHIIFSDSMAKFGPHISLNDSLQPSFLFQILAFLMH